MVITAREEARKQIEDIQKKNELLKAQVVDTENLLKSHQEQLSELKLVMEQMTEECDDQTNQTSPTSPSFSKTCSRAYHMDETEMTHISSFQEQAMPTYPTNLTHLLQTVLRTDLPSYSEFLSLLKLSRNTTQENRASTGSFSGIGISLGIGSNSGPFLAPSTSSPRSSVASTSASPSTTALNLGSKSVASASSTTNLKDTKFYKRIMVEDIEPTLRLESAPGLSWLARRTVVNAFCEGTLIVEPIPSSKNNISNACTLCGESRLEEEYARNYRFKTTDNDNGQQYPLCDYCLGRVRSTCDFLSFLRMLKDGHWRCDDEEAEKAAWDECVRLRDRMFWCRIGGGIIPLMPSHQADFLKSPSVSKDTTFHQNWRLCEGAEPDKGESLDISHTHKGDRIKTLARNPSPSPNNSVSGFDGR